MCLHSETWFIRISVINLMCIFGSAHIFRWKSWFKRNPELYYIQCKIKTNYKLKKRRKFATFSVICQNKSTKNKLVHVYTLYKYAILVDTFCMAHAVYVCIEAQLKKKRKKRHYTSDFWSFVWIFLYTISRESPENMAKKLRKEKESVHFILFEFSNRIV